MAKKHDLPKKVLGMKVPEAMRDLGWLQDFLESDLGRQVIAQALVAAAAAASAALVGTQTEAGVKAGKTMKKAGKKGKHLVRDMAQSAAIAAVEVIGQAATSMLTPGHQESAGRTRRNTTH